MVGSNLEEGDSSTYVTAINAAIETDENQKQDQSSVGPNLWEGRERENSVDKHFSDVSPETQRAMG